MRSGWWICGLVAALACLGCGQRGTATVNGTVSSQGKQVTTGYVIFHGADGQMSYGPIGSDGSYSVAGIPAGEVRVSIGGMADAMPGGDGTAGPKGRPPVPAKYHKPDTSGMKYALKRGSQQIDLQAD